MAANANGVDRCAEAESKSADYEGQEQDKTKNQLKNEAKKAAKMDKFLAKQSKVASSTAPVATKPKLLSKKTGSDYLDRTLPGEKKDMSQPMADAYDPTAVESSWYSWWEKLGVFKPDYHGPVDGTRKVFTMIMPPPNVTGSLHLGHAMMTAIEDTVARWHRMLGEHVLYLPGCDHAGISTQAVVEKRLKKEKNLARHDLGREAFVQEVWNWKIQYGDRIYDQLRRLGTSVDWERSCFTLDPVLVTAVNEAFVRMFDDGLIFRANRLVHWSGKLKTALSDLEVDMREIEPRSMFAAHGHDPKKKYEFGVMTLIAYKVEGSDDEIVISTTRPETLFADTAVAVHPKDERYTKYHGKCVIHPILGHRIPVITDEGADPDFGTGALKISPAHDHTDFGIGQKHNLKFRVIFDENNILNEQCGAFAGMARYDARVAVIGELKKSGLHRGEKPHAMVLPVCNRSGDFVEPRMMPQWWLNCKDMARQSVEAVSKGDLDILPKEHEKLWFHWLENIRDWCLSRQLWWGHRIPAYRVKISGQPAQEDVWVVGRTYDEALKRAQEIFSDVVPLGKILLEQDEDVLDTWFSSGLWPFATLGWPAKTEDMKNFYPNSLLETGSDILFFWVARMVMMGIYLTGSIPFSTIFLHAIVRDAHGRKMSKTLGNVIDPLDVIEGISLEELQARLEQGNLDSAEIKTAKEGQKKDFPHGIPPCGTDALRFALCSYVAQGRDVNLDILRIEGYRRFCNKLWNACRFALGKLGREFIPEPAFRVSGNESLADLWILSKLNRAAANANESLEAYNLMSATSAVHSFWLYELCDVYIEAIKPICAPDYPDAEKQACAKNALYTCLEMGLRMLHPFMPYVTEELYQRLPRRPFDNVPSISVSSYPVPMEAFEHPEQEAVFDKIFDVVKNIRSSAVDKKVPKNSAVVLITKDADAYSRVREQEAAMASLIKSVGTLTITDRDVSASPESGIRCDIQDSFVVEFIPPKSS